MEPQAQKAIEVPPMTRIYSNEMTNMDTPSTGRALIKPNIDK